MAVAVYMIAVECAEADAELSSELLTRLYQMARDGTNDRDRRIAQFLSGLVVSGRRRFLSSDWEQAFELTSSILCSDMRRAVNLGLIRKTGEYQDGPQKVYELCSSLEAATRMEDMSQSQKEYLSQTYLAFPDHEFTVEECSKLHNQHSSTAYFHLNNFSEMGILTEHRHPGRAYTYTFAVTPTDNPECFALTDLVKDEDEVAVSVAV